MSTQIIQNSKLWMAGYDFTGKMNALAVNYSADMKEATVLGDDTHIMTGGLKTVTMAHEGYFSSADASDIDPILFGNMGVSNVPISIGPTDGTDGELAYMMQTILGEYSPGAAVGEMFAFSITAESSAEGLVRGTVMHNATRTTSGNGTTRQLGAVASGQSMYAALHVLSGSGTLDVIIQSDDNSGMTTAIDQITFAQATGVTSEWLSAAGAITDDYWRVNYTIGGGSPSFSFVVVLGIK